MIPPPPAASSAAGNALLLYHNPDCCKNITVCRACVYLYLDRPVYFILESIFLLCSALFWSVSSGVSGAFLKRYMERFGLVSGYAVDFAAIFLDAGC